MPDDVKNLTTSVNELHWKLEKKIKQNAFFRLLWRKIYRLGILALQNRDLHIIISTFII